MRNRTNMGTAAWVQTATTKVGEEYLAGYIPLQDLYVLFLIYIYNVIRNHHEREICVAKVAVVVLLRHATTILKKIGRKAFIVVIALIYVL